MSRGTSAIDAHRCHAPTRHKLQYCKHRPQSRSGRTHISIARAYGDLAPLNDAVAIAAIAPICFTRECQQEVDKLFIIAITIPLVTAVASILYLLRPVPKEALAQEELFEDPRTGAVFESPEGSKPERDRLGELAFRAISYTPWPIEAGSSGDRLRIDVGPVQARQPRTFVFDKVLPQPSEIVVVTLPRPLGIVFEEDKRCSRVVVSELVAGGHAEQRNKIAKINPSVAASAPFEGDVLRATTCTNFVYPTQSLFGAKPPERHIVVYGADGQAWPQVITALKKGDTRDGQVTLVLERRVYN